MRKENFKSSPFNIAHLPGTLLRFLLVHGPLETSAYVAEGWGKSRGVTESWVPSGSLGGGQQQNPPVTQWRPGLEGREAAVSWCHVSTGSRGLGCLSFITYSSVSFALWYLPRKDHYLVFSALPTACRQLCELVVSCCAVFLSECGWGGRTLQ